MERHGGTAVIAVADWGIGIEPSRLAEVFGRYERAVSTRAFGGLGLGLQIVRKIVEAHGGERAGGKPTWGGLSFHRGAARRK